MKNSADYRDLVEYIRAARGLDLTCYRPEFLERQLQQRFDATGVHTYPAYVALLQTQPEEFQHLLTTLQIQYSHFFRTPLMFETLSAMVLPQRSVFKAAQHNRTWRIWSAGCANGEEAYSVAMTIHEWLAYETDAWDIQIFATDRDPAAIERANAGVYAEECLHSVKYGLIQKYFHQHGHLFHVTQAIRQMVSFSVYDLLDQSTYVPPETIFGNFDLVFCRNVLIYFDQAAHTLMFQKLWRALDRQGILVLGEAECLPDDFARQFQPVSAYSRIYQKQ